MMEGNVVSIDYTRASAHGEQLRDSGLLSGPCGRDGGGGDRRDIHARTEVAKDNTWRHGPGSDDTVWRAGSDRSVAIRESNARWSEFAAAHRTSPVSFSDDPRILLYDDATVYWRQRRGRIELYRDAAPPNTIDPSHATHYISRPRGWEPPRETGFGRLSYGANEFPFSPRERILNSLMRGESPSPGQVEALEAAFWDFRGAGNSLTSSQYRGMVNVLSELGDPSRDTRWLMEGERGQRLLQLIEMLDGAAVAV